MKQPKTGLPVNQRGKPEGPQGTGHEQAVAFALWLADRGWRLLQTFEDSGHYFELRGRNGRVLLMQTYPSGHGFEIWVPATILNEIDATKSAVQSLEVQQAPDPGAQGGQK